MLIIITIIDKIIMKIISITKLFYNPLLKIKQTNKLIFYLTTNELDHL